MFKLTRKMLSKLVRNDGAADTAAPSGRNSSSTLPSARGATITPATQTRPTEEMNTWAKTTAAEGVADAKRSCMEQEAHKSSSSSVEPKAISEPAEVLFDERQNIVDMLIGSFNIGEQQTRICQLDDVVIDGTKDVLVELVKSQVKNCFRAQDLEQNEHMTSEEAAMMVETGATQVLEAFSPKYFAARAGDLGLRPRFAVDLCGTRPY